MFKNEVKNRDQDDGKEKPLLNSYPAFSFRRFTLHYLLHEIRKFNCFNFVFVSVFTSLCYTYELGEGMVSFTGEGEGRLSLEIMRERLTGKTNPEHAMEKRNFP